MPMFTKLNMNSNNRKIRLVIKRSLNCKNTHFMQNSFSKRILDLTFWQNEECMHDICQNVQIVDYQGAEGKSFF